MIFPHFSITEDVESDTFSVDACQLIQLSGREKRVEERMYQCVAARVTHDSVVDISVTVQEMVRDFAMNDLIYQSHAGVSKTIHD